MLDGEANYHFNSQKPPALSRQSGNSYGNQPSQSPSWLSKDQGSPFSKTKAAGFYGRQYSFGRDDNSHPSELDRDDPASTRQRSERQQYARSEQRTIVAQNLSTRTTQKDLLQIIRGGTILDIFLRTNERSASISFLEGSAAQEFMNYVKRSDVYIHGKRVSLLMTIYKRH